MATRVRFAPSPTGHLHIGGLRTALFNYLYAKQTNGKIILRIEDTDQARQINKAVENIIKSFDLLDINFDEGPHIGGDFGPYIQSQRLSFYKQKITILLKKRLAYKCFCKPTRLEKLRNKLIQEKKHIKYDRKCFHLSEDEIKKRADTEKYVDHPGANPILDRDRVAVVRAAPPFPTMAIGVPSLHRQAPPQPALSRRVRCD